MSERIGLSFDIYCYVDKWQDNSLPVQVLFQSIQPVVHPSPRAGELIGRIEDLLVDPVAHRIERVDDAIAAGIFQSGQAMRAIVGVSQERTVR